MTDNITERATVFVVSTNTDLTEGRGAQYPIHFCWSRTTARRLGEGKYCMGSDCPVSEQTAYKVDGIWRVAALIERPTTEDKAVDKELEEAEAIIERLKAAGFSGDEIAKVSKNIRRMK